MRSSAEDLVITGYGVVSPIGIGKEAFWDSLQAGRGGVRFIPPEQSIAGRRWMAGVVEGFEAKEYDQPRKSLKVMCIEIQLAFAAAVLACREAKLEPGAVDPDRIGTVFGAEMFFSDNDDVQDIVNRCREGTKMPHERWATTAMANMYPLWMLKSLPNMPACHIGIWLDARGPNNTLTTEHTSSLAALMEAARVIQRGQADCMLVGATGHRASLTRLLQRHEEHYSTDYRDPLSVCRPFDQERSGTVPGMGSAVLILERRSHAEGRGVRPLARLVSWSSRFGVPEHPLGGSSVALASAIQDSLSKANVTADQLDHINASANGSRYLDASEAQAINLAAPAIPAFSLKGYTGDAGSASGLLELCASLSGSEHRRVPSTLNHRSVGDDCPLPVIAGDLKDWTKSDWLKTSLTPYGQAAAVVLRAES